MTGTLTRNGLEISRATRWILVVVVLLGVSLRVTLWPALHELRDSDELTYTWSSLQLLEGNIPGEHYVPAGPQIWAGWAYEGLISLKNLAFPNPVERAAPLQLRPFLAVDRALFDAYRDGGALRQVWVVVSFICAVGGIIAAFRLGSVKAGSVGAIFLGGSMAVLPLFAEFSVQARPYIVAWSLGIAALYFALASPRPRALMISAVLLGLAIGSRIDMLILLPLVWSEVWQRHKMTAWRTMILYHGLVAMSFILVAPWYLMTLLASLRAIATIRGSSTGVTAAGPAMVFLDVIRGQGMLFQIALFAVGVGLLAVRRRFCLTLYLILVSLSMLKSGTAGLKHQGAPLIVILTVALFGLEWIRGRSTRTAALTAWVALIFPLLRTSTLIAITRSNYAPDLATQWIEQHVPSGTTVYLQPGIWNLLPTPQAADAAWTEVTDSSAYQRKFSSGLERFGLKPEEAPRALSEINLAIERTNRRFLFILGGCPWVEGPRYDTRVMAYGPVFGVRDVAGALNQTGGVVVLRGPANDDKVTSLGSPAIAWLNRLGDGTRIYYSPDVARLLH